MIKYEIDPHNRLVVEDTGKKLPISRFRRALEGKFRTGKDGTLIYRLKAPIQGVITDRYAPHQVRLKGTWSLNRDHDLVLTLNKWRRQRPGDELTLQGELAGAEKNALLFAVTTRSKKNTASTCIIKLEGSWRADKHNRLTFRVKKGREYTSDILTLDGIWEITRDHRIIYRYKKRLNTRGERVEKSLTFKGAWRIKDRHRLSYYLDLKGESGFDLRGGYSLLDKRSIKYELGIGVSSRKKPIKRSVILFGTWKIKKNVGLFFEVRRGRGGSNTIIFEANAKLNKLGKIELRLKSETGKDLDMGLTLSRNLLKGDGEAFMRLLESKKEVAIYAGMARRW